MQTCICEMVIDDGVLLNSADSDEYLTEYSSLSSYGEELIELGVSFKTEKPNHNQVNRYNRTIITEPIKKKMMRLASPSSSPYCNGDCNLPPPQIEGITINFKLLYHLLHQLLSPSPSHAIATTIKRYRRCNTSTIWHKDKTNYGFIKVIPFGPKVKKKHQQAWGNLSTTIKLGGGSALILSGGGATEVSVVGSRRSLERRKQVTGDIVVSAVVNQGSGIRKSVVQCRTRNLIFEAKTSNYPLKMS
ncbi:hypothetical protein LXL04_010653 [Taraxacum kok-saghyz]